MAIEIRSSASLKSIQTFFTLPKLQISLLVKIENHCKAIRFSKAISCKLQKEFSRYE